jgi:hypothetical protein
MVRNQATNSQLVKKEKRRFGSVETLNWLTACTSLVGQ